MFYSSKASVYAGPKAFHFLLASAWA
uniref:Uncharacterized protein n=1 Tax=mine drainage metagenome TaxID=410659 RepID=E6PNC6_9ZZZZ